MEDKSMKIMVKGKWDWMEDIKSNQSDMPFFILMTRKTIKLQMAEET